MRVIVTRPPAQAADWVQQLRALGVDACALPLLDIAAPADPAAVHQAWAQLQRYALVMFVSPNAVQRFFALRPLGAQWPGALCAGSTGPGTSSALAAAGLAEQQIVAPAADAPRFDSEALWARIESWPWPGREVLVVRGEEGRDWLATQLQQRGAQVHFVAAYRRALPQLDAAAAALLRAACEQAAQHRWLFSSSEAVQNLGRLAPGLDWRAATAWATHPRIADTARALGFGRVDLVGADARDIAAASAAEAGG